MIHKLPEDEAWPDFMLAVTQYSVPRSAGRRKKTKVDLVNNTKITMGPRDKLSFEPLNYLFLFDELADKQYVQKISDGQVFHFFHRRSNMDLSSYLLTDKVARQPLIFSFNLHIRDFDERNLFKWIKDRIVRNYFFNTSIEDEN